MFAQVHHQLRAMDFTHPQVLGQIAVRWRKVRRVKVTHLFWVISAAGLHQHTHMAQPQAMNRKALRLKVNGRLRRAPTGLNRVSRDLWKLGPPLLIHLEWEMGQRSQVEAFRIIGATRQ